LADITIVTALVHLYQLVFTPKFLAPFANVTRWFNTCVNQPEFSKVVGKIEFCKEETMAAKAAKVEKPKAEKPVAAAAAPKAAAAPSNEDLMDALEKPAAKKANVLDDLPASSMNLDTIKKLCFSARPFLPDFFEKLWPQFDNAGYSFYTMDYKYDSDNKEFWKLGNSLGGYVQRSDACRKYAMGSIQAAGPEDEDSAGPWSLTGVWLFRGQDLIAEMKDENPDSEYYNWAKVDVTTDAGKAKVKEYYMGETVNGLKVLDRRYFK
jgi:elongation factor 1-gamma